MSELFSFNGSYTLAVVAAGATLLGMISGMVGSLAMLKKQSLLADAISHASLPGIVIAFILTGVKSSSVFLAGAAVFGWFAAFQVFMLVNKERMRQDSMLSLVLSVYFGFGMILLSFIQHKPKAAQSGIENFLFGQAATMLISDVKNIMFIGAVILIILLIFWKELLVLIFDPVYAASLGYPVVFLEFVFSILLVGSVVIGLQAVGVVLMSSMLVAPAVAARQWTNNIFIMMITAAVIGGVSGFAGSVVSGSVPNLPTGPSIVICASILAAFSIGFAPKRGIYWRQRRRKMIQESIGEYDILRELFFLSLQHPKEKLYGHPSSVLKSLYPMNQNINKLLDILYEEGYATATGKDEWSITEKGIKKILEMQNGENNLNGGEA